MSRLLTSAMRCLWATWTVCTASVVLAGVPTGDPILDWNHRALEVSREDYNGLSAPEQGGPTRSSRALAIVHAAMYDAFNSIDGGGRPYLVKVPATSTASKDAAVAVAACLTLKNLFPRQTSALNSALQTYLAALPSGLSKTEGQLVGSLAANAILTARALDGKPVAEQVTYRPSPLPGFHRVDPLNPNQGYLTPGWGLIRPFVLKNTTEFMIPPPPALNSVAYATAFNEVKAYGAKNSSVRTEEQTIIGIFWGYDGAKGLGVPPRLYNQCVRAIAVQQGNTPRQNARLFALVNLGMADVGIAAWDDKYDYNFWRPVVAIREADVGTGPTGLGDGNPGTAGDVNWEPLGAPYSNQIGKNFTPPFPAYASGHATFGAVTFQILTRFYGTDHVPFDFVSDEYNGVTTDHTGAIRPHLVRHFETFSQATQENADSRIYLGVHWRFDATAGVAQGTAIGNRVFDTALIPAATQSVAAQSNLVQTLGSVTASSVLNLITGR